jgi:hypothetical protein
MGANEGDQSDVKAPLKQLTSRHGGGEKSGRNLHRIDDLCVLSRAQNSSRIRKVGVTFCGTTALGVYLQQYNK